MELWLRLWIWLLSLVLPVVGTDGLLRMLLVSILRMGRMGRSRSRECVRGVGQHGVFAHRSSVGKSLYRQLWSCDPWWVLQHADRPEHLRRTRLQHQHLHWQHGRLSRRSDVQPEYWNRGRWRRGICWQHLQWPGHGESRWLRLQHQHECRYRRGEEQRLCGQGRHCVPLQQGEWQLVEQQWKWLASSQQAGANAANPTGNAQQRSTAYPELQFDAHFRPCSNGRRSAALDRRRLGQTGHVALRCDKKVLMLLRARIRRHHAVQFRTRPRNSNRDHGGAAKGVCTQRARACSNTP